MRAHPARKDLPIERECCLLALVLSVEVRNPVFFLVIHADDDSVERRDDWHKVMLIRATVGITTLAAH